MYNGTIDLSQLSDFSTSALEKTVSLLTQLNGQIKVFSDLRSNIEACLLYTSGHVVEGIHKIADLVIVLLFQLDTVIARRLSLIHISSSSNSPIRSPSTSSVTVT